MANTPVRFNEGSVLTTSATTAYASPASTKSLIKNLTVTNYGTAAVRLTLYLVPSGGTPAASNTLVYQQVIPATGRPEIIYGAINHVLEAGDTIQALSDTASAMAIMISGFQVTP